MYDRSMAAFAQGDRDRDAIADRGQLEARREMLREKLIAAIGGLPSGDTPLNPRTRGVVAREGYVIEKVMFESRPRAYVTANLYVPDGIDSPRGAVLFLCGHDHEAKHGEEYQTVCGILVKAGLVVLAMDPIGQGERFSYYDASSGSLAVTDGIVEHDYAGQQCLPLGDGLARYFLHDAMRAVDYLAGRPEVDPARIGVTGNSGGGTQTSLMMLADPRIAAAAPATFIMSRESYLVTGQAQDAEQIWFGMTALGLDHEDILMAMAPKPVLVLAVTNDFFPIEGTHRTVERVRRIWTMYGCEDRLRFVEDDSHHKYTVPLAQAAAGFFREHLLADSEEQTAGGSRHGRPSSAVVHRVRTGPRRHPGCARRPRGDHGPAARAGASPRSAAGQGPQGRRAGLAEGAGMDGAQGEPAIPPRHAARTLERPAGTERRLVEPGGAARPCVSFRRFGAYRRRRTGDDRFMGEGHARSASACADDTQDLRRRPTAGGPRRVGQRRAESERD
ncbi:acetylxylan esterase [Cohnella ginsengisoli]|uniref:Acetylxylan esterase n=1 Tax=Cohnella ginsengisoli TaxID=425004 RepID=A0A9X4KLF0_9BACL|nr:acetylxylan esterase [Cohnella ginsengisoli]MDG0794213.1 acetylxylan esterase [Cohnella ginsengisoli]